MCFSISAMEYRYNCYKFQPLFPNGCQDLAGTFSPTHYPPEARCGEEGEKNTGPSPGDSDSHRQLTLGSFRPHEQGAFLPSPHQPLEC